MAAARKGLAAVEQELQEENRGKKESDPSVSPPGTADMVRAHGRLLNTMGWCTGRHSQVLSPSLTVLVLVVGRWSSVVGCLSDECR